MFIRLFSDELVTVMMWTRRTEAILYSQFSFLPLVTDEVRVFTGRRRHATLKSASSNNDTIRWQHRNVNTAHTCALLFPSVLHFPLHVTFSFLRFKWTFPQLGVLNRTGFDEIIARLFSSSCFTALFRVAIAGFWFFISAALKLPNVCMLPFSILQSCHPACQALVNPAVLEVSASPSGPAACHS